MEAPVWLLEEIDRWTRAFFWTGKEKVAGGQCLVAWQQVCKPLCFGGLVVKNLRLQGLALHVRWEWLKRTEPNRPWQGLPGLKDVEATDTFNSLVSITVGDGAQTWFWKDRWVHGAAIIDFAPVVLASVSTRRKNSRTVQDAVHNHGWINDVGEGLGQEGLKQCVCIFALISYFAMDANTPDSFSWPWSPTGCYSAQYTYRMLCLGGESFEGTSCVWRSGAPLKCKIFAWLALQRRLWTSDRGARNGLQDNTSVCFTYLQDEDKVNHVLAGCVFSRQVWHQCLHNLWLVVEIPTANGEWNEWWLSTRARVRTNERMAFDTLVILVSWRLLKRRNARFLTM
ncbi:uncharacterized protein [Lolium perenne]|uniref:uncharacterized protein n=1 Tax=Lolium perenne TaxID=4522 RepID=UPI003A99D49D